MKQLPYKIIFLMKPGFIQEKKVMILKHCYGFVTNGRYFNNNAIIMYFYCSKCSKSEHLAVSLFYISDCYSAQANPDSEAA